MDMDRPPFDENAFQTPSVGSRTAARRARPRLLGVGLAAMAAAGFLSVGVPVAVPVSVDAAAAAAPAYPGHLLQYGSRGPAVAEVQRALHITADGIFGPHTRAAVIAFQRSHGLAVDGIVGPQTWGALFPPSSAPPASSRGGATVGHVWTVDTALTRPSGVDARSIDDWVRAHHPGSPLAGDGQAFVEAEQRYGVNAQYLLAHAIEESAWGTSSIARNDNNLFGFTAYDSNPGGSATHFSSHRDCILTVARYVKTQYLTPGGAYYVAPTLRGMNVHYATDPSWASNIAAIASSMRDMRAAQAQGTPSPPAAGMDATRRAIVSIAESQVGTGESPPGSNCTKYGACESWCSDFATWVWRHAGVPIAHLPYSGDVATWGRSTGRLRHAGAMPQPGDVLLWGSWSYSTHISVVTGVDTNGSIHTVDGNWGNTVARRTVSLHTVDSSDGPIYAVVSPEKLSGGGTSAPAPHSVRPYPGHYVQYGMQGPDVAEVQSALGINADGIFGPQTLAAVKSFQWAHGLSVDGIVGPLTWAALFPG